MATSNELSVGLELGCDKSLNRMDIDGGFSLNGLPNAIDEETNPMDPKSSEADSTSVPKLNFKGMWFGLWRLTGFYGNPKTDQRHHDWTLLRWLHSMCNLHWIVAGDFNEILADSEKCEGLPRPRTLIENFRAVLDDCDLQDLGFTGSVYTWSNKKTDTDLVQERLDRCVSDFQWRNLFPASRVRHLEFWRSDHRPILLEVSGSQNFYYDQNVPWQRQFHVEECLADHAECEKIVKRAWFDGRDSDNMKGLASLDQCTTNLGHWYGRQRPGLLKEIRVTQGALREASNMSSPFSWADIHKIESELNALLDKEEIYRRQRSRENWLHSGDRNSKYFHWKASFRRAGNRISVLFDSGGNWVSGQMEICRVVETYFKDIFSTTNPNQDTLDRVFRDRARERVQGWQNKLFLAGGEEVLLKAVVQAIPTYYMSLFRLQQGLIEELHKLSARFWWGSDDEKRKIHQFPTSGIACFRVGSFLKRAVVGVLGVNTRLIRDSFLPEDADLILSILCSSYYVNDSLVWHYDNLGSYSVRSGYHLRCNLLASPISSGLVSCESWWKYLWCMKLPTYRASHDWLPTWCSLWCCPALKQIRVLCPFMKGLKCNYGTSLVDFMMLCRNVLLID
ncbi:hypothetical protein Ddye_001086 [Dipteronia dyeriana]|uniref:Reverse transcriptase n=1 Tax=Dipteronia dyeriana TaxID=168575 RepID=A0AAD9XNB4_9ROSI|nr:hypothetical protein Ddye_001086 [Dipteronia dyeriana]